jgi:hypothetical protein
MSAYHFADDTQLSLARLPANTISVGFNAVSSCALGTIAFSNGNDDVFAADLDGGRYARITRTSRVDEIANFNNY